METQTLERKSDEWKLVCLYVMYLATYFATIVVTIRSGNVVGGLISILGVTVVFSALKVLKIKDQQLLVMGTIALLVANFFYFGSERQTFYLKNGERRSTPFFAIPFYDHVVPAQASQKGG